MCGRDPQQNPNRVMLLAFPVEQPTCNLQSVFAAFSYPLNHCRKATNSSFIMRCVDRQVTLLSYTDSQCKDNQRTTQFRPNQCFKSEILSSYPLFSLPCGQ
jgi:hypothetical protein